MTRTRRLLLGLALAALSAAGPEPGAAAGFELPYQAGKAAALGGAFVAQADDPSAIFYNPGGIALLADKPSVSVGASVYTVNQSLYQGLPPGIGAGTTGEQESQMAPLLHLYWVKGFEEREWLKIGLGLNSPFLWQTEWRNPDVFAGRGIALGFDLQAYDLMPTVAIRPTENLGLGASLVYRLSELGYTRREQFLDPGSGELRDFAGREITTPMEAGFGVNAGFVYRLRDRISLGFTLRSPIEIDYAGTGKLTQIPTGNPALDELFGLSFPFDQDLGMLTTVEFPGQASTGVAAKFPGGLTLELDLVETGWSSIDRLAFEFPTAGLDETVLLELGDTTSVRAGVTFRNRSGTEFRAGFSFEESPQPDRTVSPLLPDADRTVFTFGLGKEPLDVAFVWIDFGTRRITDNLDGLNGNYSGNAWLLALTVNQ